jgi:hypothetical protein
LARAILNRKAGEGGIQPALGRHLLETGQLRDGTDLGEVRDVLWNYLAVDHYERPVLSQGWSLERYSRWPAVAITAALCPLS